jgi:hypothetical protein
MDARVPPLVIAWLVLSVPAAAAVAAAPAPALAETVGVDLERRFDAELELHDAGADQSLDPSTLADLDDLLLDPVDLNAGDLERLRVIPWLPPAALESLRHARPLIDPGDLVALPQWDAALARSVRPFVRLDAPRQRAPGWQAEVQALDLAARREIRMHARAEHARLAARVDPDDPERRSGHLLLEGRGARAVLGDLRLGASQGLSWWSSELDLRAGSAPYRRARGLVGNESLTRTRVLRGAGVEVERRRCRGIVAAGARGTETDWGSTLGLAVGRATWAEGTVLHVGHALWGSVGLRIGAPGADCAVEVSTRTPGFVITGSRRWGKAELEARIESTQRLSPLAAPARTGRTVPARNALLYASRRWGGARIAAGCLQGGRSDSSGTRIESREEIVEAAFARGPSRVELRLRQRRVETQGVEIDSAAAETATRTRGALVRLSRRVVPSTTLRLEYRAVEFLDLARMLPARTGSAWQLRVDHRRRHVGTALALTSFAAPSGLAMPVVPEPGATGGAASVPLHGDGVRAAASLQVATSRIDWRLRSGHTFGRSTNTRTDIETSLLIRWR